MTLISQFRRFLTVAAIIAIGWSGFHLYAAAYGTPHSMVFRPLHVALGTALVFAGSPVLRRWRKRGDHQESSDPSPDREADEEEKSLEPRWVTGMDLVLVAASLGIGAYYLMHSQRIAERVTFIDDVLATDIMVGLLLIILVLEACRRVVGVSLSIVALVFLGYQMWGDQLSGALRHPGLNLERFIDLQFLSPQGMFGTPVGVSADYVFYFILFAAFLEVSGGGRLFIDIALSLTGKAKGGPAKASIIGSALMGSINGSAVANVVGTGVFTIPLMKRMGFKARFAAGVEAMASTGGQLLPPIMGAGAFIMAQMLGMPYYEVVIAALIPALLYFAAGFFMVDKQARRDDLQPLPKDERTPLKEILTRLHLLIPLGYLVYMILSGRSLMASAFEAIIVAVVVGFLRRQTWFTPVTILTALESGARRAVAVALPCALAGIVVGVIVQTNLGRRFTDLVLSVSGGNLVVGLVVVMVATIILGMGMPTTSAYIMAAVLMAPPLIELGVPGIAAHLFIFYFACLSMITPPVALAAFAAAGIAGSPIARTGITAFVISLAAYLVPYAFVFSPALLMQGGVEQTVWYTATALLGVYALSAAVVGYESGRLTWPSRLFLLLGAVALIFPGYTVSGIAALAVAGLVIVRAIRNRQRRTEQTEVHDHADTATSSI
ncbi:TRAP transporter permease [Nesterenkonia ebinurensis]|uniref:TRAP transporter permease n=1 Tax=Nesterenkonia ebinurensis TaxID=2608252 RepID=UPI00123D9C4E|nr:TRAP transporter permease [Nesterenkonia ebinurensis]